MTRGRTNFTYWQIKSDWAEGDPCGNRGAREGDSAATWSYPIHRKQSRKVETMLLKWVTK